ncbi:hypothetical protein HZA98_04295 [Candidatus Woesearchaeota archaeon]|nr:hypothetical protein [Candidatus Woesearchaeota archaeon]
MQSEGGTYNPFGNQKVGLRERAYLTGILGSNGFKQYTSPEHSGKILLAYRPYRNEDLLLKTEGWIDIKTGKVFTTGKNLAALMGRLNERTFIQGLEKSLSDNGQNPALHPE